ncbi:MULTISPECIES: extracellular matrix regulator RemB [Sporomusa]|jgi:regulator of extracellular matrix RemA (YlzA/DUF370 family)|uniref:DUF370 domain-containing protein n=2 Tax=Sporomusa TaxID=2375 RepID=A0ABM9W129_9FIRM|nr:MULTISPECIES: DUF370 domain-containing protein [Sporomusa]MCM0759413.1 DUF370 domain-containing protein [Sporomusa sphaeroides DSM 2875]OLS56499.1 hypothetical protein SPSPH_28980 [Sporomusa sphaeroides DSM 2875]CVK18594.1 hypothetical protein SSPH_01238 [Sporomusa sphaeroides DSM 2875]SCM82245.1 conserved hypothetical protein [uncultured Sporomusa sp.]HML35568.1 DUF370 domain-containing protein [Sporomusa sphaeroides]
MFLHIGADTVIPLRSVIAILDFKITGSAVTDQYMKNSKSTNKVIDISDNNAKSFVITDQNVYLSAISSQTLKKRAGYIPVDEE